MDIHYGICGCGGVFEQRSVDVHMTVGQEAVTFEGVPQGACPQCGTRVYKGDMLDLIEAVMQERDRPPATATD